MSEKAKAYQTLFKQCAAIVQEESDEIANLANISALIQQAFGHHWVGFYLAKGNELVLGPFQGPPACTRIAFGKGVCGIAALDQTTLIVPDVHKFPGHIACSAASNSEIVVPLVKDGKTHLVLDVDSTAFDSFDELDQERLERILTLL